MKILVIGGSYFYGRVFVMQTAGEHDIMVVNRGTYSMEELGARQIKGDRHDPLLWQSIEEDFDVAVDFCAYEKGDIRLALDNFGGHIRQYILISTVDVYERAAGSFMEKSAGESIGKSAGGFMGDFTADFREEDAPFETRIYPGEAGAYIAGKVALEQEIAEVCAEKDIRYTVLRPGILYGPYNYAPRESMFIRFMVQQGILPHIMDATGQFQLVYVKDAVCAVQKCLLNEKAYGQAYNLCQDQMTDYDIFYEQLLKAADTEITEVPLTCKQAEQQGLLLPFPLTKEETQYYSNRKSREELGLVYTELSEGMARTYRAFRNVYSSVQQ